MECLINEQLLDTDLDAFVKTLKPQLGLVCSKLHRHAPPIVKMITRVPAKINVYLFPWQIENLGK